MPNHLDKEVSKKIVEYLRDKPKMPHVVACHELEKMGIKVTANTIVKTRKRHELEYIADKTTYKIVMDMYKKGTDITRELLNEKLPDICPEYVEYILMQYAKKKKATKPHKMQMVKSNCNGKLFKFKNVTAHISHGDYYSFQDDENEPVRVNTLQHAVSQMMKKYA